MTNPEDTLRQLLKKIATEQEYDKPEIIINELSSGGANYTSKLFTVIIKEENKEDLHLFAKVAVAGDAFRNEFPIDIFKTEQFAYLKLVKIYASLEEENGVPEEHRLHFSKLYGFDPTTYQETLVLDNLLAQGYSPHDRFHSVNWEYASSAVAELAKMHALSFAYSDKYPEEYQKVVAELKMDWKEHGSMDQMLQRTTGVALNSVKPEYKEALEKFMMKQKNPFSTVYAPGRRTAIIHTDFRGDNLLNRVREDGKMDIKIVDLQNLQGGSPVGDLINFIFSGTDERFRAKYFDKLVDHYYTELSAAMRRLNLNPEETYSKENFDFEMKEKLPYGLTIAVFVLPLITVDSNNAPKADEVHDFSTFQFDKISHLYAERLNGVVNDYVKWGILI